MEQIKFCIICGHKSPEPNQKIYWMGGKGFCRPSCPAYQREQQKEADRKYAEEMWKRYGPKGENWYV